MVYDCIIAGAGAAGLFASASFSSPVNGLILEKTAKAGTKLLMSGSGQCNITHTGFIKDFIPKYGKNGNKIRSCLYPYHNQNLVEFLEKNGVPTVSREDGKIFPKSMRAEDVLNLLLRKSKENGFRIRFHAPVKKIKRRSDGIWQVEIKKGSSAASLYCRNLILATGGCSYPTTGSDGSLFPILKRDLHIEIIAPRPALASIYPKQYPYRALAGISFSQAGLTICREGKIICRGSGPLLLTHEGFSGPLMLNFSKYVFPNDEIMINYLYPCEKAEIREKIKDAAKESRLQLQNLLPSILQIPRSFLQFILEETGKSPEKIAEKITGDCFTVKGNSGFSNAMATAGGISLSEIYCKTMESRIYPGLYFIGEMVDIDGETGGYNLQFAYSSARAAQTAVCRHLNEEN